MLTDARTIGGLLVAEYRSLISYSRRLTSNGPEATDLVHMVCARVLSQQARIAEVDNVSAWLRTVLFRLFVDSRRRARWEIPTDEAALDRPAAVVEPESALYHATVDDVRILIPALPTHYRVPYELFTFEGMSYARISVELGLSSKTVGTRINRARKQLRVMLQARHREHVHGK
jgi:RNA polymerase sigma-70 factor (ECF subfamily)